MLLVNILAVLPFAAQAGSQWANGHDRSVGRALPHAEDLREALASLPRSRHRHEEDLRGLLKVPKPLAPAVNVSTMRRLSKVADRRLDVVDVACSSHASCRPNEYCLNCTRCAAYHASLPRDEQEEWTCDPCGLSETRCESGQYCQVAHDAIDGKCPTTFPGCDSHDDCDANQYCYGCTECQDFFQENDFAADWLWKCEPCPTKKGGFCAMIGWCSARLDAVDGKCPQAAGCQSHSDCQVGQYCEGCAQCQAFQKSLPPAMQNQWTCDPCPTVGGGMCEDTRFCQVGNDGIDGKCPDVAGCQAHWQCLPDEYCSSCAKCAAFYATLPSDQKDKWTCDPCPTTLGGACSLRQFCSVAQDNIGSGPCPTYKGCAAHSQCEAQQFCMNWRGCENEIGVGKCGPEPSLGGLCLRADLCTPARSFDGICAGAAGCNSHAECNTAVEAPASFCTLWEQCEKISPGSCGTRSAHKDGVCLPLEHCVRGLHAPVDGSCPLARKGANATSVATLVVAETFHLNGTMDLATTHQAMNVWKTDSGADMIIAQLRDSGGPGNMYDDNAYVGIFTSTSQGAMRQDRLVNLSCPTVEISIPTTPRHFFEARISLTEFEMSTRHAECSCIAGEGSGRCPRAASYEIPDVKGLQNNTACQQLGSSSDVHIIFVDPGSYPALRDCQGSVYINSTVRFSLQVNSSTRNFRFTYYRLDTFQEEDWSCGTDCPNVSFDFRNQTITCTGGSACKGLLAGDAIPVLPVQLSCGDGAHSIQWLQGGSFCASCLPVLPRIFPVIFRDVQKLPMPNNITLYTLAQGLRAGARLVDSSLAGGEGAGELGCPKLGPEDNPGLSLHELTVAGKVLPPGHVTGRWCVVKTGGCSLSMKYKLCVLGGAAGVIFMDPPDATPNVQEDKSGDIYIISDEMRSRLVPLLYSSYDPVFWAAVADKPALTNFSGIWSGWGGSDTPVVVRQTGTSVQFTTLGADSIAQATAQGSKLFFNTPAEYLGKSANLSLSSAGVPVLQFQAGAATTSMVRLETKVSAGPWVGARPRHSFGVSTGGVRAYNVQNASWKLYASGLFGSVQWMQESEVRDALFICTSEYNIVVLDTSNPDLDMALLGEVGDAVACSRAPSSFRDYHMVDIKQGSRFYTVMVDNKGGNRLLFYDTTDLTSWTFLAEVHADWEHNLQGLGQAVATPDGTRLLLTWHCSTTYCGEAPPQDSSDTRPGERIYILGLKGLASGRPPPVVAIVEMPMSRGSIIRDVECDENDICVASLSWDGIVAFDIGSGANRYRVIGQHSPSFSSQQVPADLAYARMMTGAQKVYGSWASLGQFYIERWSFDLQKYQNGTALANCLRYDSVWTVNVQGYRRRNNSGLLGLEPPVTATLQLLGAKWEDILASFQKATADGLMEVTAVALQDALAVDPTRIAMLSAEPAETIDMSGAAIDFRLLAGTGPSPHMLITMLMQQVMTEGSAFRTGPLARWSANAQLIVMHQDGPMDDGGDPTDAPKQDASTNTQIVYVHDANNDLVALFGMLLLVLVLVAVAALLYATRMWHAAQRAKDEARNVIIQAQSGAARPPDNPDAGMQAGSVIGRPADQPGSAAGGAYVVGRPLGADASAAADAASGMALTEIDIGKLEMDAAQAASAATAGSAAVAGGQSPAAAPRSQVSWPAVEP